MLDRHASMDHLWLMLLHVWDVLDLPLKSARSKHCTYHNQGAATTKPDSIVAKYFTIVFGFFTRDLVMKDE